MSTLLRRARASAARALAEGALLPLGSEVHHVEQDGVRFVVRSISRFTAKPRGTVASDPFAPPYDEALFLRDWGPAHAVLLNKFPVLPDHLLLVTRAWADQEDPMDPADWDALDGLLAEVDGLGFYNGGRDSGASQPHRHLQLVPRETLDPLPLEPAIRSALRAGGSGALQVPGWPVPHVVAAPSYAAYRGALESLGRDPERPGPHSALRARDWLLVVPRRTGDVGGIPVNSLGYVGLLVVKDPEQLARVRADGPWSVLAAAAG